MLKAVVVVPAVSSQVFTGSGTINVAAASGISIVGVNRSVPSTINLPATPAANQIVIVSDVGNNSASNNLTVSGNGNNIIVPNSGSVASVVIGTNGADFWFWWNGTTWSVLA